MNAASSLSPDGEGWADAGALLPPKARAWWFHDPGSDEADYFLGPVAWREDFNLEDFSYFAGGGFSYFHPRAPRAFETPEFKANPALGQVGAQSAYARGATGFLSTVAVVDEDFDLRHPDLIPNIVDFRDFTFQNRQPDPDDEPLDQRIQRVASEILPAGHGTNVAGVIAAARNGRGVHGVAPEAALIALRADSIESEEIEEASEIAEAVEAATESGARILLASEADGTIRQLAVDSAEDLTQQLQAALRDDKARAFIAAGGFDDKNVAKAVGYAARQGADIVNLSLGGGTESEPELIEALQRATSQGVIVVASAGNDGLADPEAPANLSADPRTNGLMLAVGAVDAENKIADFSHRCGSAKARCLVAPGVGVVTTTNGGGVEALDGTSFSAPMVSGSLALLLDLFPTISSQDAVQILLATATDLGEAGVDEVFGHGLVNLERAVQPVGVASLPLGGDVRGKTVSLASSTLSLGSAFGDALSGAGVFAQGVFLDGFRRPFKVDLRRRVAAAPREIDFGAVLEPSRLRSRSVAGPAGWSFTAGFREPQAGAEELSALGQSESGRGEGIEALRVTGVLIEDLSFSAGHNLTAGQQLAGDALPAESAGLFLNAGESLGPHHGLLDKGRGFSLTQDLYEDTALTLGFFSSDGRGSDDAGRGKIAQADLTHRFEGGATIGLRTAFAEEAEGFLGSQAEGAFGSKESSSSLFYSLSGSLPLSRSWEAFGSYTFAMADLSKVQGGLVGDLRDVMAEAFALGLVKQGVLDERDRLGFLFSQPLRVTGGASAELSVPSAVNADGSIVNRRERVGLEPSGRELNLQLVYDRELEPGLKVSGYALTRLQPGHDADAEPDFGAGVKISFRF